MPLPRSQHASGGDGANPLPTSHNVRVFCPLLVCTGLWLVIFPWEQPAPAARWRSSWTQRATQAAWCGALVLIYRV